jgi:hypothetical protein
MDREQVPSLEHLCKSLFVLHTVDALMIREALAKPLEPSIVGRISFEELLGLQYCRSNNLAVI